jgi:KTSC domain-containing protein
MDRKPIVSSTIKEAGYEADTQTFEVLFNSGGIYDYAGVPQEVYDRFLRADSKGSFFAVYIRACFPCTHLNPKPKKEEADGNGKDSKEKGKDTAAPARANPKKEKKRIS